MTLKAQIDQDLKNALKSGDERACNTLRLLKSEIANREIALGLRQIGLDERQIQDIISKEVKKRRDAALLYNRAKRQELAANEEAEILVLAKYLPKMLSSAELERLIDEVLASGIEALSNNLERIIAAVKAKAGNAADGAEIARLVKERVK